MCGIVGYIGQNEAYPVLIAGLKKLEYRGYDSAGVALVNRQDKLNVYKTKGKVANLEEVAADKDCGGHIGIAHTRWATHGEPSAENAHPHASMSGDLALVHNGIIEELPGAERTTHSMRLSVQEHNRYRGAGTVDRLILSAEWQRFGVSRLPVTE